MGWNKVAIVGVGMTKFGELYEKSHEILIQEAFLEAVAGVDKGIDPKEIQAAWFGACRSDLAGSINVGGSTLTGSIGLKGIHAMRVDSGGATGGDTFRNACIAVGSGVFDVALALGAEKMRDVPSTTVLSMHTEGNPLLERGMAETSIFAALGARHMYEFGTTKEQMASVTVKNRKNGVLDPYCQFQSEITIEDVLNSPIVCQPFNLLDCCAQSDGAAAAIVCRADLAEKYTDKPVYVAGMGMGTDHPFMMDKDNFIQVDATIRAAKEAFRLAGGIGPKDIDVAEIHDSFSITELISYEDLGFCEKGEGGKFIESGATEIGGRIPVNPSGGILSRGYPISASGLAQIAELFWQFREEVPARRQVKINNGYALQHDMGGKGYANAVVNILTNRL